MSDRKLNIVKDGPNKVATIKNCDRFDCVGPVKFLWDGDYMQVQTSTGDGYYDGHGNIGFADLLALREWVGELLHEEES